MPEENDLTEREKTIKTRLVRSLKLAETAWEEARINSAFAGSTSVIAAKNISVTLLAIRIYDANK